ncbi:MAG: hypothetical protein J6W09_03270, partial [Bacteroidales bacterium]|nr:hypothetical protein [Bacteroidales bacterium]
IRLGVLSVWTFFTYTFGTVFSCVFFYCLAGGVSSMSRAIGFILAAILALFMFGGDISDEDLKRMDEAHIKRQQEEEERRRRKEDEDRWERQQRAWDRDKNA